MAQLSQEIIWTPAAAGKLVTGGPIDLWTIGGTAATFSIAVVGLWGYVTTAIGAVATTVRLLSTPTSGTSNRMCVATAITSLAQHSLLGMGMDPAVGLVATTGGLTARTGFEQLVVPGVIQLEIATGGTTGDVQWYLQWYAIDPAARVLAA